MKRVFDPGWRALRELAQAGALAAAVFFMMHGVMQAREVDGPSMQPTFHTGERLYINRLPALQFAGGPLGHLGDLLSRQGITSALFSAPHAGDIVVFDPPVPSTDDYIKRVIGQPGDRVTIVAGSVYVNGALLSEPYLHVTPTLCSGPWCDVRLGDDEYYVLGDNRPDSSDSRAWGPVTADRIAGAAWLIYYPLTDAGIAH